MKDNRNKLRKPYFQEYRNRPEVKIRMQKYMDLRYDTYKQQKLNWWVLSKNRLQWVERYQNSIVCKCGCGNYIKIQACHKTRGIPKFISGHNSKGQNNPRFNNWSSKEPYTVEFYQNREKVFKRDGYFCQLCSSTQNLIPHHKDGDKKNSSLSNLLTLCAKCNGFVERKIPMLEKQLYKIFKRELRKVMGSRPYFYWKFADTKGIGGLHPFDSILVLEGGKPFALEFKVEGRILSPHQKYFLSQFEKAGGKSLIVRETNYKKVLEFLKSQ